MSMILKAKREGQSSQVLPLRDSAVQRLGASAKAELRYEGEPALSGLQAEVCLKDRILSLRKVPRATNPIYCKGHEVSRADLAPGESFVVGKTLFVFQETSSQEGLAAGQGSLPQRLQLLDLLELPEILRLRSPEEALAHVAAMMRLIVGARWVEVTGDGGRLAGDASEDRSPAPPLDPTLLERARGESPRPVWSERPGGTWSIACVLPVSGQGEFCFHLAGSGLDGQSLEERSRLTGLIADMAARNIGLRRMEDFKQRLERFFSGQVATKILASADAAELEPRLTRATVMFFDIRGFSRLAEQNIETALHSVRDLRRVMTAMTEEIFSENGVVIQFMGDGILACWNLPYEDPAAEEHACRAALKMVARLKVAAPGWACGIGIHAGELVAGSLGSEQVFSYTVMGMVVNQASRVEGITKVVECPILATAEVASRLPEGSCLKRRLGRFQPAGMGASLELYQILPAEGDPSDLSAMEQGLVAFESGDWQAAYTLFDQLPASDLPARYLKALAEMHRRKPPKDWQGVIELDAK